MSIKTGVPKETPITEIENPIKNPFEAILWHIRGFFGESLECQLVGRILTIIDGAISNEKQNKAVKDMLKQTIYEFSDKERTYIRDVIKEIAKRENQEIKDEGEEPRSPIT